MKHFFNFEKSCICQGENTHSSVPANCLKLIGNVDKLSDHIGGNRLLFVSHSCPNYPLGSSANIMDNGTVGRRRNISQIVSPLNTVNCKIHRRMRLGRIQDMLKVQGHMLRLSRESLDFIRRSSKTSPSQKSISLWSLWLWTR